MTDPRGLCTGIADGMAGGTGEGQSTDDPRRKDQDVVRSQGVHSRGNFLQEVVADETPAPQISAVEDLIRLFDGDLASTQVHMEYPS